MALELSNKEELTMKRVELKRIAELLWKGTSSEEKTPFAQCTVAEHGSISKSGAVEDNEKPKKELSDDVSESSDGPMSTSRMFCFLMSFNVWIMYFVAFAWLIPCRIPNCGFPFEDEWETNLTYVWPLTNVETFNVKGLPSLAMLAYEDGTLLNLAALATINGTMQWNNSLPFIPREIQCNFEITFDANRDGIPDCLLTGYNDVYAFNASNGYVFWEQNLPSDVGNIVSSFHPTMMHDGVSYLIGTCGGKIVVLDAHNGTKIWKVDLPCSAPFEIRIVPNVINKNFTLWHLVCDYGDKIEAWAFAEEDVLKGGNSSTADALEFALLFSRSNSGGSIDLGCDVTTIPGGPLLLSWSDRVVMVTSNGTAWEKSFSYPVSVASIEVGHFTNTKDMQVAAAVHNETNTIIYILETENGTTINSVLLEDRQPQFLEKIVGDTDSLLLKSIYILETENGTTINSVLLEDRQPQFLEKIVGDTDSLLLKSISMNLTSVPMYNFTDPIPRERTNFALIEFKNNNFVVTDIVTTAKVLGSALEVKTDGEADLLLIKTEDGIVTFQKYVIYRSKAKSSLCDSGSSSHVPHFASEM